MSLEHNTKIIDELDVNDFVYLEKDLDFYEKVSLIFLLHGDNPVNAKIGRQKLLILYQCQNTQTTDISDWIRSQNDSNWRYTIIEALWTIKAKHVLQKLGLDLEDLRIRFLEHAELNLKIHPVLKVLYYICEQLVPCEARLLIDHVNSRDGGRYPINFTDEKYLEVFLLHWLAELVIEAGEWSPMKKAKRNVFCKVDLIVEFLNSNKPDLAELLKRIYIRFNFTSNNVTSVERKKNVTDVDGQEDTAPNAKASGQDARKNAVENSSNESDPSDNKYVIEQKTAGHVLIINQIDFYRDKIKRSNLPLRPLETRHGTNEDKAALNRTFSAMGYQILEKDNLTDDEIRHEVKEIVAKSGSADSLIVCILSHGSEGLIYGCNSVPVKINEIQQLIVSKELLNKPKILILQSCQGLQTQIAEPIEAKLTNSKYLAPDGEVVKTVPMNCDFCVAKSTIPGFSSIRHMVEGSWFIQILCDTIARESHRKHFLEIMTVVKGRVSELRGDNLECMVPICEETFTKYLYFPSRELA
ncbi:caspase-8-like isoform X2 [Bradysia coprophila]|uniref:caspase-8-like isoform X2 n=1 Tax=Bradysia coprophila TaxID=38358 RepID=UPI00187DC8C0|nr:caspase-8-like isoform X2 [Bradysia coprophila]